MCAHEDPAVSLEAQVPLHTWATVFPDHLLGLGHTISNTIYPQRKGPRRKLMQPGKWEFQDPEGGEARALGGFIPLALENPCLTKQQDGEGLGVNPKIWGLC